MLRGRRLRPWLLLAVLAGACGGSTEESGGDSIEVVGTPGEVAFPDLEMGVPADLSFLGPEERNLIQEADSRAESLRTRPVRLLLPPGSELRLELVRHGFPIGVAIEVGKFQSEADLQWYSELASRYFNFAVLESDAKWSVTGPEPGVRDYSASESVLAWGQRWDLDVKGHVLLWGNEPPLSSSGIPEWLRDRYPLEDLTAAEQNALRGLVEHHIRDSLQHFAERIPIWDITNETLQPLTQWFIDRLGTDITNDAFRFARESDPDATLVMNEWITEIFTGIGGPTAAQVRDRLVELLEAGVPIDAVGIQAQFTPAIAHIRPDADVSERTPLDVYQRALDTIAEAGLPIHVTEINVFTPEDPRVRAAHLEGAMRLWWGHPSVAQIGFWSLWNGVSGKRDYDVGLYDDEKHITPMGKAALHLLNDRWRTRTNTIVADDGVVSVRAAAGDYLAQWTTGGQTHWASFEVAMADAPLDIRLSTRSTLSP